MTDLPGDRFGLATLVDDGAEVPAVLTARGILPLTALIGADTPGSVREVIVGDTDAWLDRITAALPGAQRWRTAADVDLAPPLPDPSNLYLAGANYYDHVEEMGVLAPDKSVEAVFHFLLPSACLVGSGHPVQRPAGAEELDWEVELAVVIGRRAERVSVENALDHVAGYTVANDVSVRGAGTFHPIFGLRFLYAKGQAGMTAVGPAIVPARFVPHPGKLALSTHVNGELRQDSSTEQMIWTVEEQIAHLSSQAPLLPGDIILTGTPAGTAAKYGAYLADGDVITSSVEGLGVLTNQVVPR